MEIRPGSRLPENVNIEKPSQVTPKEPQAQPSQDQVNIGGTPPSLPQPPKKWTFLHYGAGDNNLSTYIKADVDEMETVGSDANTNLVTQLDQSSGNCKRYMLQKHTGPGGITSPVLQDMGPKVDMSNPKTLTDFLVWGITNFPSERLALSIGDHGGGTAGAITDDRDGSGIMKPQDIEAAIKDAEAQTGKKLDILAFDCCLMANTEVAYQLKDVADFLVASEENEGGAGWPYNKVVNEDVLKGLQDALAHKINLPPKEFVKKIINDSASVNQSDLPTMTGIELSKMNDVKDSIDNLGKAIIATSGSMSDLKSIAGKTQSFGGGSFRDIYDFAQKIVDSPAIKDEKLKEAAKGVVSTLSLGDDKAIIAEEHSARYPNAHGLQIELKTYGPSASYKELAFAKDSSWDEALAKMGKAVDPPSTGVSPTEPGTVPGYPGYDDYEM